MLPSQAMERAKAPYKSSPVMKIRGRALNGTTSVMMVFEGYCRRAGLMDIEKEELKKELKEELRISDSSLAVADIDSVLVYLDNFQGRRPKFCLTEKYLIAILDQLNPTISNVEDFLKSYYYGLPYDAEESIKRSVKQELVDEHPSWKEGDFHRVIVYLLKAKEEVCADGITKNYLTEKLDAHCNKFKQENYLSGADPRLLGLGRPQYLVWQGK